MPRLKPGNWGSLFAQVPEYIYKGDEYVCVCANHAGGGEQISDYEIQCR